MPLSPKSRAYVTPSPPHCVIAGLLRGNFPVRPPGQEGTAGAPWPALFLSRPRRPRPSQSSLGCQPLFIGFVVKTPAVVCRQSDPVSPKHWSSSAAAVRVPFLRSGKLPRSQGVMSSGLAHALLTRPRGQGKVHPWLFQAELGTLPLPRGSCWT